MKFSLFGFFLQVTRTPAVVGKSIPQMIATLQNRYGIHTLCVIISSNPRDIIHTLNFTW
jgi:hypothetical protein